MQSKTMRLLLAAVLFTFGMMLPYDFFYGHIGYACMDFLTIVLILFVLISN